MLALPRPQRRPRGAPPAAVAAPRRLALGGPRGDLPGVLVIGRKGRPGRGSGAGARARALGGTPPRATRISRARGTPHGRVAFELKMALGFARRPPARAVSRRKVGWRAHVARGRARRRLTRARARARRGRGARPGRSGGGAGATRLTLRAHPHAHTPSSNHGHGPLQARARRHRRGVHVCAPAPVCVARARAELSKLSCGVRVARLARSRRSRGGVVAS